MTFICTTCMQGEIPLFARLLDKCNPRCACATLLPATNNRCHSTLEGCCSSRQLGCFRVHQCHKTSKNDQLISHFLIGFAYKMVRKPLFFRRHITNQRQTPATPRELISRRLDMRGRREREKSNDSLTHSPRERERERESESREGVSRKSRESFESE